MQIRDMRQVPGGPGGRCYYAATVVNNGVRFEVDRRYGSWQLEDEHGRRDVLPWLAAKLQAKLPKRERTVKA